MRILQTKLHALSIIQLFAVIFFLTGCAASTPNNAPWTPQEAAAPAQEAPSTLGAVEQYTLDEPPQSALQGATVKVAILLPLTGQHAPIGRAMLNAAQMALFDLGFEQYELLPKDTKGTPDGARNAANAALSEGAQLVLGPLLSEEVQAVRQVTQPANINLIAFSTDWTLANSSTYLIGFLPFDQVERVTRFAAANGAKRIGVISPTGSYGNGVVSAYQSISQNAGVQVSRVERFNPDDNKLAEVMRGFSDYDARKAAGNSKGAPSDAVLMPVGGPLAREVGSFLNHYDLMPQDVRRLGTGLMDDPALASDSALYGTWFAAPSPALRRKFERRYSGTYADTPPRIASLAYDATALSIILARIGLKNGNGPAYDAQSITNPNGFSGVDGIFRFRRDGIVERGLSILEFKNGGIVVVNEAPSTFQNRGF